VGDGDGLDDDGGPFHHSNIPSSAQDYRAQSHSHSRTVPLIDGHNDIPDALRERAAFDSVDFAVRQPS